MMKQLQKMRRQMRKQAKALGSKGFGVTVGGGTAHATVIGSQEVGKIIPDKDAVDPSDVEILEDLIKAAVSEVLHMVETENQQVIGKLTGGLPF